MKYCAHCGAELYDEAAICTKCGCAVDGVRGQYNSSSSSWNGLAIAGFVLSFVSTIIGLVLSIIAYKQVKNTGEKGKELALAGIIISAISIGITIIVLIIYFGIFMSILSGIIQYGM